MKTAKCIFAIWLLFVYCNLNAQAIKDGETVEVKGFKITFNILNEEKLEIKGEQFIKYKVNATVTNVSGKSLNVRFSNYPDAGSITAGKLIALDCTNATGAKLTSKKLEVSMKRHDIKVNYYTKDNDGKLINATMTIPAGYYLEDGDKVEDNVNFIVPAAEKPNVNIRLLK